MNPKIVFITVFHSFISKNFLNTEAFKLLREDQNVTYILLVPENKKSFFENEFGSNDVKILGVESILISKNPKIKFYSAVSHLLVDSFYLWYKKIERRDKSKSLLRYIKYYGEITITFFFGNKKNARTVFRWLFIMRTKIPVVASIFDYYKPDLLFSSDIFDETDSVFCAEAKRRNIPIVGMVRSWDNCYSKGVLRVIPHVLIVNNRVLEDEAISLHDVPQQNIRVSGLPQYDELINGIRTPRGVFFNKIGADSNKKLILFSPAGAVLSDTDGDILDILRNAIVSKKITEPAQVLVRNHPHHPAVLDNFPHCPDVIIERPGMYFGNNTKEVELTKTDVMHLADSLYHSDIVIYVATTLGIDSLVFDKPQIIINFDGYQNKRYVESVKRYHNEDHMKKMIKCGGVWMVDSEDDLICAINEYFKNPDLKKDGRECARKQQILFNDGKSSERVAQFLKQAIIKY